MNLRSIDLNLLTVFDAIFTEGSQARAAEKLGMSQPAMSNALSRLRDALNDPLFIRSSRGMSPSATARVLAEPVRDALGLLEASLTQAKRGGHFDFASSTHSFVLAVEDIGEVIMVPRFVDWLMQISPAMRIRILHDVSGDRFLKKVGEGTIDLALSYKTPSESNLYFRHLVDEPFVSLVRGDHPLVGEGLSLEQYIAMPHVVYGRLGSRGIRNSLVDAELKRLGLVRNIALQVPSFQSMPLVVRSTNFICTLPWHIAMAYAYEFRLKVLQVPLNLAPLSLHMIWGKVVDRDPAHVWLRESFYDMSQLVLLRQLPFVDSV